MQIEMSILRTLIEKDFEFQITNSRYLKTREHSSLVLDTESDIFFWNSRNIAGDSLTWLTAINGMSFEQAKKRLTDLEVSPFISVTNYVYKGETVVVLPELVEIFWEEGRGESHRDYWYRRGINDRTIDRFRLGWHNGWNTIPIFVDGIFINFQIRRDNPDKRIKSWYRGTGSQLFNSDLLRLTPSVIISESPTDAILLQQNGFPAISHTGGATGWNEKWFSPFMHLKSIFILYDNDKAGRKGARKVSKNLGEDRCKVYTFGDYPDKYDTGDFFLSGGTSEELTELLETKAQYSFET